MGVVERGYFWGSGAGCRSTTSKFAIHTIHAIKIASECRPTGTRKTYRLKLGTHTRDSGMKLNDCDTTRSLSSHENIPAVNTKKKSSHIVASLTISVTSC